MVRLVACGAVALATENGSRRFAALMRPEDCAVSQVVVSALATMRQRLAALIALVLLVGVTGAAFAHSGAPTSPPPVNTPIPTATAIPLPTLTNTPLPTPTSTPTFEERYGETILGDIFAPIVVTFVVGILTAIGGYLIRPHLDDWRERRWQARRDAKEATQRKRIADARAATYLANLIAELRDLKILDMTRPLDLERTYVRLRVWEESRDYPRPEEETELDHVERDPDEWMHIRREWRERRTQAAIMPEEALRQHRCCVVLGDPGAGKTTMLKHLALCSAQGRLEGLPALPVFIPLHLFVKSGLGDLLDFVAYDWEKRYGFPDARPYLESRLEDGDALLLLDGLDEVNVGEDEVEAEVNYRHVIEQINTLVTRYRHAPVMVTSRLAGWRGGLAASFYVLGVLDLGLEEIQQFVENWFYEESEKAAGLQRELARSARMATMAANPLLLSLIAIVFQKDLELPERRARLYERCVQVLLTEWDASREIQRVRGFTTDHKRDLLEGVAWHFHRQGRRYFPQEELLAVIADFLPKVGLSAADNERILSEIAAQHGLLKEQAIGWYGFLHLTLQEYFAALAVHQQGALDIVLDNLHRPWWEEVTLLLAGMGDATPLLQGILGRPEDIFHSNLRLAGRCLAGRPRVSDPGLRAEILARLRARLREGDLPTEAELLARVLAELGGPENNALLLTLLGNEGIDTDVRQRVAVALGALGERRVAPRLVELLADEGISLLVRWGIAAALGALGERSVASCLVELLADEGINPWVRLSISDAVGALGERSVAPRLIELLAEERINWQVRQGVAVALGALGERSVAPRLIELLAEERINWRVRQGVAAALGALGERSVAIRLIELLAEERINWQVRQGVAAALGALGERSVASCLIEFLADKDIDTDLRQSIATALGVLGERSVASHLVELLADERVNWQVRKSIAAALGVLGERSVASHLVELLADERVNWQVRKSIAAALGALGERSVAPRLNELLADAKMGQVEQMSIAVALGVLGEPSVAPRLVELLADERILAVERESIAVALGVLGERSVASHLVELLADERVNWQVRESIASALEALGERSVIPRLVEFLADERVSRQVRKSIATALGALGDTTEVGQSLAALLYQTELREAVYAALYRLLQRAGVRVLQHGYVVPLGGGTSPS